MFDYKLIQENNIIAKRYEERYEKASNEIKKKLDAIDEDPSLEKQMLVIKRKRSYPEIGDIFQVKPTEELTFYGIVVNNHIDNINGDDLLVVMIFNADVDIKNCIQRGVRKEDLLIPPEIVGKEYWTRGYFYTVDKFESTLDVKNYGFYDISDMKFYDEYENDIGEEPELLGVYGVATIFGIGMKLNQELIFRGIL